MTSAAVKLWSCNKKGARSAGSRIRRILGRELRAGWRHNAIAIDLTCGGIEAANIGVKSTGNLLQFLLAQKAGASPAQYSGFQQVRH